LCDGGDGRGLCTCAQVWRRPAGLSGRHDSKGCSRRRPTRFTVRRWSMRSFDQVGSPIHVGLKDANLIAAAPTLARVPMPSHNVYRDRLLGAVAHGDGERDQGSLGPRTGPAPAAWRRPFSSLRRHRRRTAVAVSLPRG
jgi:hypothetical protein